MPTAGGRKREKGGKTGDAKEVIAEMKSETRRGRRASVLAMARRTETEYMTLATTNKSWLVKCHGVDKGVDLRNWQKVMQVKDFTDG
jgi:hypothetical protein